MIGTLEAVGAWCNVQPPIQGARCVGGLEPLDDAPPVLYAGVAVLCAHAHHRHEEVEESRLELERRRAYHVEDLAQLLHADLPVHALLDERAEKPPAAPDVDPTVRPAAWAPRQEVLH